MSSASWQLAGRTVLITGAARGIGAECARRLAACGMRVALVGLEADELAKVASECGPDAIWFEADVTDRLQLRAAVEGTIAELGRIDATIANAGVAAGGPMRLMDPDAFERVIEVNLLGAYRTIYACLPQIVEHQGYVLIVASMATFAHLPGMAAYAASKAGVEALGNSLRGELSHHGASVGIGYLSRIDTDMMRAGDSHPALGSTGSATAPAPGFHPVSDVGDMVVEAFRSRAQWICVPKSQAAVVRKLRSFQTAFAGYAAEDYSEREAAFERDVAAHGVAEASRPVAEAPRPL